MSSQVYSVAMPDGGDIEISISADGKYALGGKYFNLKEPKEKIAVGNFYKETTQYPSTTLAAPSSKSENYDLDFNDDEYKKYGYFLNHLSIGSIQFDKANFGVLKREDNSLWCVFVPIYENKIEAQPAEVAKNLTLEIDNTQKIAAPIPRKETLTIAPQVFVCKLENGTLKNSNWFSFLQWVPNLKKKNKFEKTKPIQFFDDFFSKAIFSHHLFAKHGANPFNYLPYISNLENCFPIFGFKFFNKNSGLDPIFCSIALGKKNTGTFEFKASLRSTTKSSDEIDLFLETTPELIIPEDDWIYNSPNNSIFKNVEVLKNFFTYVVAIESHQESTGEPFIFDLKLKCKKLAEYNFVNGSIQFSHRDPNGENPELIFKLSGSWDKNTINLSPSFEIKNLPCNFSYSPLTDLAAQNNNAVFDTNSLKEDELHREGGIVISKFDEAPSVTKEATLNIRSKTQKHRNAIVEWSIKGKQKSIDPDKKPRALYFQAKPFSLAQIESPDHDDEGGEKIAFWRSDDSEGPQWRIADSEMTIYLPPQAVGEEMERGKRFWESEASYIKKDKPLKYRFSPPTKLSVMLGTKVRRYNSVPNNLQIVLKESLVKEFETEIIYPINTKFKVNSEGLPHIRISETAFFTGRPAENLPVYPATNELRSFYEDVLANEIAEYTSDATKEQTEFKTNFENSYKSTRLAHSAVRANWTSRIAQYHLYDPYRADGKLMLSEGLAFKIRGTKDGAPPLINPLPNGVDFEKEWMKDIVRFLENSDFVKPEVITKLGALRAGVIYTLEFPSVLHSVLTNNSAKSTNGIIEELSFTPLGANGYISVAFDEGKTIFKARVHHGQISRLENIRIGRLGVLWNKARHVIVYERTTVPSEQFQGEQSHDFDGWPIIRKTEEYIEPIEIKRKFDSETSKDLNACGFIESSEFISQKIYVNSAWGKNYQHGYAIPLWKTDETNHVYAKPTLALNAYAGEETTKQVLTEPEHLYFYTNTERETGKDSDQWKPQIEIDLPEGLCRLPVITGAHLKNNPQKIISAKQIPAPSTSVSSRRPRYDLAVYSSGPVNLQQLRGETQMLAAMHVISLARTGEVAAPKDLDIVIETIVKQSEKLSNTVNELNKYQLEFKSFFATLEKSYLEEIKNNKDIDCNSIKTSLETKKVEFLDKKKDELKNKTEAIVQEITGNIKKHSDVVVAELLEIKIDYPPNYLSKYVAQFAKEARDDLSKYKGKKNDELTPLFVNIKQAVDKGLTPIIKFLDSVEKTILEPVSKIDGILKNDFSIPIIDKNYGAEGLKNQVRKLSDDYLARLTFHKGKNKLLDVVIGHLEKFVSAQIILLNGLIDSVLDAAKIEEYINILNGAIGAANSGISSIIGSLETLLGTIKIKGKLDSATKPIKESVEKLKILIDISSKDEIEASIKNIFAFLDEGLNQAAGTLLAKSAIVDGEINSYNQSFNGIVSDVATNLYTVEKELITQVVKLERDLIEFGDSAFAIIDTEVTKLISKLTGSCEVAKTHLENFLKKVNERLAESKEQVITFVEQYIDKDTQKQLQELAKKYETKAEAGLKLVKALGDMPKLDSLDFNALAAEYVFGDFDKAISTSPYAVKLKEIDDALNGLGLTLPSTSMLDQFVPCSLEGLNFRDVFNNMGGIDFKHLFEKFKLDNRLKSENIIVTHGLDKVTRQAWVKAEVKANLPEKQSLFELSSIGVSTTNLKLNAISEQRVDLQGKRQSINNGKFISDFALDFSGNKLAVFKDVTISFDNGKFDFDISPDKVELHPSIKFVSDIAKQIQGSLPPYIEVVKDANGNTKGVRSSMNIEVANPPDFGAVKIGTLILYSGIQLQMVEAGKFEISTFLSVGKKETPIFLQIGELGGGMWLETTATQSGPNTRINANLGLAVGNTRRKNIGNVASGEYSIMLFAYANYQIENGDAASQFRAGISVYGSARVLSIANATIYMLLEAIHDSQNGSKGVGILDVSISMGRFYTIKIKQQVEQKI